MAAAERIAEYLKQCGVFYLATLDGIRKDGRYTVFRLASGNAVITDFTGKTEEIEL